MMTGSNGQFSRLLLWCSIVLFTFAYAPQEAKAQCANDNDFESNEGIPPCGTFGSTSAGAGTFATFTVTNGATYEFRTCGTFVNTGGAFNTRITGYQGAGAFVFQNDNSGTCSNSNDSRAVWTANFSGTLRVLVDRSDCNACLGGPGGLNCPALGSAVLDYRQVDNLVITSSGANMCPGQSRNLTASPAGGSFSGTGVSGSTFTAPATPGAYNITYTLAACTEVQTITVQTPSVAPTIVTATQSTICPGQSTTLTVQDGSLGTGAIWRWYIGGCGSGGSIATGAAITVSPGSSTTYFVRAEGTCNSTGCASIPITVGVESVEATAANASSNFVCSGDPVTLSVTGGSLGTNADWEWYVGGCGNGASIGSGASISVNPTSPTTYFVRAEGGCNTTGCKSVFVDIKSESTAATGISRSNNNFCPGASSQLSVVGGSLGTGANWVWYQDICCVAPIGNGSFITVSPTSTTDYFVRAEGDCNNTTATSITVTVLTESVIPVQILASQNPLCVGSNTTLSLDGGSLGTGGTWRWYTGTCGGTLINTGSSIIVNPASTTTYFVRAEGTCNTTLCRQITIDVSGGISISSISSTPVSCNGGNDGSTTVNVTGGIPPYSYVWSGGANTQTATGLAAGPYTVTVSDAANCSVTGSVSVTEPTAVSVNTVTGTFVVVCNGDSTGSVTASVSGGTPPYDYQLNGGAFQASNTFSNLPAGSYDLTVRDDNACILVYASNPIVITELPLLVLAIDSSSNVTCSGANDGAIYASAAGGTAPYSYSVNGSPFQPGPLGTFTGLASGTFTVLVQDANGCQDTASVTLVNSTNISIFPTAVNDVSCFGLSDGDFTVGVTNGTNPLNFTINGITFQPSPTFTGLSASTYTVQVVDAAGCVEDTTVTVAQPTQIVVTIDSVNNVGCNGATTGGVFISVAGGTPGYTYAWSNGPTTEDNDGIAAGAYTVTVTDANGCTATASATVTQAPALLLSLAGIDDVSCNGEADGKIDITVVGGTPGYAYSWSNGSTNEDLNNVGAGTYDVTVTDANGCTVTNSYTVSEPPVLTASTTKTDILCNGGATGAVDLTVAGGTAPYNYLWSNGAVTEDISGLTAGTYTAVVQDANGCTANVSTMVVQPNAISISGTIADETCFGDSDGAIDIIVQGGTPGYTYAWSSGPTTEDLSGLAPGNYTVTVTDAAGCTAEMTFNVPAAPLLVLNLAGSGNISCNAGTNGFINISVTGGVSPYTYSWSNGATSQDLNGVVAGTYDVTVTDNNGCTITDTYTLTEPTALNLSLVATPADCNNSNTGSIDLTVSGGTPPYSYLWSNFATTQDLPAVTAGEYTVVVTDGNGCQEVDSVDVADPNAIVVTDVITTPSCFGVSDGAIDITVSGGTGPYTFVWSNGSTTEDLSALAGDNLYTVTVTDANGCDFQDSYFLQEPDQLDLTAVVTDGTCDGSVLGSINLTVDGGTAPFNYAWSNGAVTEDINNLAIASYTVTVTDANGCSAVYTESVGALDGPQVFAAIKNVTCNGGGDGEILLTILGGNSPFTFAWSNGATTEDILNLSVGSYSVTVTGVNGCQAVKTFNVSEPTLINLSATHTDADCGNGILGSINLSVSGGTSPYTYLWTNGQTTQDLSGLVSGTYTVVVTDANGCTASLSETVNDPSGLTVSGLVTDVSCNGFNDGEVDVTVAGGAAPYTYAWSNGAVTEDVTGLSAGVISITVTDNTGCGAFAGFTVSEPTPLSASFTTTDANCAGTILGSINMTPGGGTAPYTFVWSTGANSEDISSLVAGVYDVTITDINGCTAVFSASVTAFDGPQLAATVVDVDCNGGNNGSVFLTVTGPDAPFTFNWSNGTTFPDLTGVTAGTYNVTVTNSTGCDAFATYVITEPSAISAFANVTNADCGNGITGAIDLTPSGGTAPYTYLWATGQTTQDITGLVAGNYTVVITDANGCDFVTSFTVTDPFGLALTETITDVSCNGGNNGAIDITPAGGTAPYSYAWSNGAVTEDLTGLTAGSYTVTVTDNVACDLIGAYVVTEPGAITLSLNTVDADCGNATGAVDLAVTGGTAPYTYAWSNGPTTQDVSALAAGTYDVTVTDANGCTTVGSANVSDSDGPLVSGQVSNVSCNGGADGEVNLSVSGVFPPFTYAWSNGSTFQDLTGVAAGTYTVTVTNDSGCVTIQTFIIGEPSGINLSATTVDADCINGITGSIDLTVAGGTPPYTYLWATGQTTQDVTGLFAGTYTVVVTDANGCEEVSTFTITDPSGLTASGVVTDVTCFGDTDGAIDVTPSGGTPGYTFAWSNGPTTEDISALATGIYAVTVTDAAACNAVASFIVDEPDSISLSANITNLTCSGNNDGGIDLLVSGGTAPYTYAWSNGPTTQDQTGLAAATYTVTVTDANSCTATLTATVIQPGSLTVLGSVVDVACAGETTGAIFLTTTGGTPPFLFSWSNGETTQDITSLAAATYDVTVTDQGGCTATASFTVSEPLDPLAASTTGTDADCANGITGTVDLTVTGGTTPYSYSWDNGATTQDLSGLSAGVYSVIVTDANGCTASASYTVNDPNAPTVTGVVTDPTCSGGADGAIDITATGGTPPYTYAWTNGAVTEDLAALAPGIYGVTVTDNVGCEYFIGFTLTDPSGMIATTTAVDANCSGTVPGSIDLTVTSGTPPYTYNWSTGAITQDITGLLGGTYTVTITDANGCSITASENVSQADSLEMNAAVEDVACNGDSTGAIFVTPVSGVPPYSYLWSTGDSTSDILDLTIGSYTLSLTDNAGCLRIRTFVVGEPAPLDFTSIKKDVTCNGDANGEINISVFGGTGPYSYLWSSFDTTQDLTGVIANRYTVIVTDNNFCTVKGSITITEPSLLEVEDSVVDVSCNGAADGGIFLTPSGGTPPYTYNWSNGATTQNITGLSGGSFAVTVTDDSLCIDTMSFTIVEPAALATTATATDATCPGENDGTVDLSVTGGTAPYTYAWNSGQVTEDLSGVVAGTYNVTVTDANGCTILESATVSEPPAIVATPTITNVSCFGLSDGAIDIAVAGGTPPYDYFWNNGDTTEDISGLTAGAYLVTITDANNCVEVEAFTVSQPSVLAASAVATDVSCNGFSDGTVDLTVTGGTPAYTYLWSNGATTEDLTGVSAGVYTVTVTDANGCTVSTSATVNEPLALAVSGVVSDVSCFGGSDGAVDITVAGGTTPYTFAWSNGPTTEDIAGLVAGTYDVTITDGNGCTLTDSYTVSEPDSLDLTAVVTDVSCNGGVDGRINLTVTGGTTPYTYAWSSNDITQDLVNLSAGTYTVTVTDANGCIDSATYVVNEPAPLTSTPAITNVSCNGGSDGAIDLTIAGGTPTYRFLWSSGDTTEDLSGLTAGTYTVQIIDANNCVLNASYTVTEPALLEVTGVVTDVSCNGGSDGAVNVTVTGGTSPYGFAWSNGATTEDLTGLVAGTYILTVTDANGCTDTSSYTVNEPTALVLSANVNDVSCFGGNNGVVDLTVSGGTPAYTYAWSNGATTQDLNSVVAGTYVITVTDANGCIDSATYIVNEPPDLVVTITGKNISCNGVADGAADADATGGTPPYTYAWSNGDTTQDISGVAAGVYTLTVTDGNGCIEIESVTLTEPPLLNGFGTATNVSCAGGSDGAIDVTPIGGTPPYTYQWSNTDTTQDLSGIVAGPYTVTITDDSACTRILVFNITEPDSLMVEDSIFNNLCYGDMAGRIDITVTGGTPPFSYSWSNGEVTQDLNSLVAGVYSLTLMDANSCVLTLDSAFTVGQPDSIITTLTAVDVSCSGFDDGFIDLTVTGGTAPYSYFWSPFRFTEDLDSVDAGRYVVIITDTNGCQAIDSVVVGEPNPLVVDVVAKGAGCGAQAGGLIDITPAGGTPPYTYLWSTGDTTQDLTGLTAGAFEVTVTDANGCFEIEEVIVPSFPVPEADFDAQTCNGLSVGFFNNTTIASGTIDYVWTFGDGDTSTDVNPVHVYAVADTYTVTLLATSDRGCEDIMIKQVIVKADPAAQIFVNGTNDPCAADSAVLSVDPGAASFLWSTGGTTNSITAYVSGNYGVTVVDTFGCVSEGDIDLVLFGASDVQVSNDTSISLGFEVPLFAIGGADVLWQPGTYLDDSTSATPTAQPLENISYEVTITDVNGCTVVDTVTIEVRNDFVLVTPNLFTPNGDGFNDTWNIQNITFYDNCEVIVFNRWGSEVYRSENYQNDWDGTQDGSDLPDGTYYYVINCQGAPNVVKGAVNILR